MTSAFFEGWKGFGWSVLVAVIMVSCFLGLSSSQNDSQDQAAIEQALRDALPKEGELPTGITWDQPNYRPEFFDIDWTGHRVALECPYGMRDTRTDIDNFYVDGALSYSPGYDLDKSPQDFRSRCSSLFSRGTVKPYPDLPGGLIWEDKNIVDWIGDVPYVQAFEFEILFWKSPTITGSVKFNLGLGADCAPPTAERQAEAEALARSECERLAKLVYDRLPGGEPSDDYAKIISVLRKYKEVDFRSFSDEIVRKALKDKETSDTGKGITENLRGMVQEIDNFNEALKQPLTSQDDQNAPLVKTPNVNWLKLLKRFIEALAPSSLPLDKIRKIKELLDEIAKAGVNAIEIPHGAEEMYNGYRNARDDGADPDGAYSESGTANYFEVRKADEFKGMGPTQVDIELMKRFEERYKLEKAAEELEKERQKILADPDRYINVNFVNKYQDKIDVLYRKCEELKQ